MAKAFFFLLFVGALFAGSFIFARKTTVQQVPAKNIVDSEFHANPFPLQHKSFTIVIVGLNNGATVQKTLSSLFSQIYDDFRVIYIDDASDDGSFELARDLIYDSKYLAKVTLVHNEKRLGVLPNLFRAVQSCSDSEIVVILGGEDWLAHEWVLQRLNAYYDDPDLWLSTGQYCVYPSFQKGDIGSLYTFYAGLFKKIQEADCKVQGILSPLLEIGKDHFQSIPEVLTVSHARVEET